MYRPNLKSVALLVPEIIAIGVLGFGCKGVANFQSWGKGMVPFERVYGWLVSYS